jgi:hypothetical protein
MSVKSFKFVSPGVFINEIDNSFTPRGSDAIGPVAIGRASRGIAMKPVQVQSFSEFVELYGDTVPGNANGDYIYRNGNFQSPMYGTYAAKAFLNSNVAPLTYIRLLGQQALNNDGTLDAKAGWVTEISNAQTNPVAGSSGGGAFGFFVADGDTGAPTNIADGLYTGSAKGFHLGAIIYVRSGSVSLKGTIAGDDSYTTKGSSTLIKSDEQGNFTLVVNGSTNGDKTFKVNFNESSKDFISKQLNTNPLLATDGGEFFASTSIEDYWLGETFDQYMADKNCNGGQLVGIIAGLSSGSADTTGPHNMKGQPSQEAVAGWFVGQHLGNATDFYPPNLTKLFRLIGLGHGEWLHKNLKVSIENIRASNTTTTDYGTFSVVLRALNDTDDKIVVLERFDNCNLDPSSPNFIARQIGDTYEEWDSTNRRLKSYNTYPNRSKYVRVDMNEEVEAGGVPATLLPFGYFAPPKFRDVGNVNLNSATRFGVADPTIERFLKLGPGTPGYLKTDATAEDVLPFISSSYATSGSVASASFFYPEDRIRTNGSDGGLNDTDAYFGFSNTTTAASTIADLSVADNHRLLYIDLGQSTNVPVDVTATTYNVSTSGIEGYSDVVTLDNISGSHETDSLATYVYVSGSRKLGTSTTARTPAGSSTPNTYKTLLDANINKFTAPFWGGFDGLDITKPDPFYNEGMTSATETNSYAFHTIRRAIDTVSDPEFLDMNLLAIPGITNTSLTKRMIDVCEERGDALAVIDLPDVYRPIHEKYYATKTDRIPANPNQRATDLQDRKIDSSYGCTFYPWVQTRDDNNGQLVWVPPSVAMMGVFGSSERQSAVWFAPAGFNRGGLTNGAAGIAITNVSERLISRDRDTLYEARINPIASFPSTGIVVFGQKTLQERASALDRINVRRLVIFLKKQISIASAQILFEQNVQTTWNNFINLVDPILANVKSQFGITDYRLILDNTTTTPDLIDQNILYAKIMVKPARAIEFIAIDFAILNTGASFDD